MDIKTLPRTEAHLGSIRALLEECGLPTADLASLSSAEFIGIEDESGLAGIVGLELRDDAALLRSLAVRSNRRGSGSGRALVAAAERKASELGCRELFLLTMNAGDFFERQGYVVVDRASAPAGIKGTQQFSGLCPDSAAFMCKRLA